MKMFLIFLILMVLPTTSFAVSADTWVINARTAKTHMPRSTVLDVRSKTAYAFGHIPNSIHISWQQFSKPSGSQHGELLPDAELQEAIRQVGVSNQISVIVIGDPEDGWGEDGRIVWMLRAMGHHKVALVDGGMKALKDAGFTTVVGMSPRVEPGNFTIAKSSDLIADAAAVQAAIRQPRTILVDTREKREFEGKTPYGEKRGGHVPTAKHLYFRDLLDEKGYILKPEALAAKLDAVGISKSTPVIAYCTGGIRSGWMVTVLRNAGYTASNYPGSMWDWAAKPAASHPLE